MTWKTLRINFNHRFECLKIFESELAIILKSYKTMLRCYVASPGCLGTGIVCDGQFFHSVSHQKHSFVLKLSSSSLIVTRCPRHRWFLPSSSNFSIWHSCTSILIFCTCSKSSSSPYSSSHKMDLRPVLTICSLNYRAIPSARALYYYQNHKNYNFLNCDCFKKLLFPTNSLAKMSSDSLLSNSLLSDSSKNQPNSEL